MGVLKLKDLIRAVRACKTQAEERAVIAKESANIRTAFKEEVLEYRHTNVAKLLYVHMLGYAAQWGQMECVKLVASPRFADKRLGYLGIMLLLDENMEVLTLVTNSLKNDMNNSNSFAVGLALCTMGNISSPEMAHDLAGEVEKLLGSSNYYVRKKAALCALRCIRKVPDLLDNFVGKAKTILNERHHAALLTGVTLITQMCEINQEVLEQFRKPLVPVLIRHLKNLLTGGAPGGEHDVTGITDPFLQCKILRLLRVFGKNDPESSDAMNDILAQVATNTETSKNVGNAIVYEAVQTIMDIKSESGLRVLAINILGRFLTNRDNNIRYVALHMLNKTVNIDNNAVQRHRTTIIECLRDGDISIRRRALELSFALINESNVRVLTRELLSFLEVADNEFKPIMTTKIFQAAESFAPNKRWHVDTILRVLKLAGSYVKDENLASFIKLIAASPELHSYAVQKLYLALKDDISQESLVLAAVWVIGEFGDVLLRGEPPSEEEEAVKVTEKEVLDLLDSIQFGPFANAVTRDYVLTAYMKLSVRFATTIDRIKATVIKYTSSIDVELQQRAVEYALLFQNDQIRASLLERMPAPEYVERKKSGNAADGSAEQSQATAAGSAVAALNELDLLGTGTSQPPAAVVPSSGLDLVSELLGGAPAPAAAPAAVPAAANVLDLLSAPAGPPVAYDKDGLKIIFTPARDPGNPQLVNINAIFTSSGPVFTDVLFQAAVPKTLKLQLQPPSSTNVSPGADASQLIRVANPSNVPIRMKLKLSYKINGAEVNQMGEFNGFPEGSF